MGLDRGRAPGSSTQSGAWGLLEKDREMGERLQKPGCRRPVSYGGPCQRDSNRRRGGNLMLTGNRRIGRGERQNQNARGGKVLQEERGSPYGGLVLSKARKGKRRYTQVLS